jgi:NADH:ubiquinone oxidoreductase subunit D
VSIDPSQVRRYAHGSRVPGWDDSADLSKDPAVVPDPATTPVPAHVRTEIEAAMAKYPDVRSDGSSKPARVHMRDPSFVNLQALKPMCEDAYIADFIATLAMLDPVLGGIDR